MATPTANPLLKLKLNGFEKWAVSQLFGSQWQTKIWNSVTQSIDKWVTTQSTVNSSTIQSFVTAHVDDFINAALGGNPFLASFADMAINSMISPLVNGLMAYVQNEAASLVGSALPPPTAV
jgi:DNA-binding protein Fis